jgi:hypothetical protein
MLKISRSNKQAKVQWLQDQSEINGGNVNNVRCEANRYFRNKKREYLKDKINELEMNSKNNNIRDLYKGINEFKRGYQPRNNLVKDENDLLADSHNILNRWKIYFSQLLNVHNVSDHNSSVVKRKIVVSPKGLDTKMNRLVINFQSDSELVMS